MKSALKLASTLELVVSTSGDSPMTAISSENSGISMKSAVAAAPILTVTPSMVWGRWPSLDAVTL